MVARTWQAFIGIDDDCFHTHQRYHVVELAEEHSTLSSSVSPGPLGARWRGVDGGAGRPVSDRQLDPILGTSYSTWLVAGIRKSRWPIQQVRRARASCCRDTQHRPSRPAVSESVVPGLAITRPNPVTSPASGHRLEPFRQPPDNDAAVVCKLHCCACSFRGRAKPQPRQEGPLVQVASIAMAYWKWVSFAGFDVRYSRTLTNSW